ncbi:MAG: hypothetical protein R3335_04840 [Anaerolineales bacterium]|nr:hypothetical protein [Anaerolineales bacterium]
MSTYSESGEELQERKRSGIHLSFRLLMLLGVLLVLILAWPLLQGRVSLLQSADEPDPAASSSGSDLPGAARLASTPTQTRTATRQPATETATTEPEATGLAAAEPITVAGPTGRSQGVWVLSMREGQDIHLFAYHPATTPITRLTAGAWQDISPAVSPDGAYIAFASNRSGQWDLYTFEFETGITERITDTPEYEAYPSWSPDGLWLAYESFADQNLEIYVRPVAGDQPAIRLTNNDTADFAPAWSPVGRQIAFVSDRSGDSEIWVANLDRPGEDQFVNVSRDTAATDLFPAWSPGGERLAWAGIREGLSQVKTVQAGESFSAPVPAGSGDWPVWSPDGTEILARLSTPNENYLISYRSDEPGMVLSPAGLTLGPISGITWAPDPLPSPLPGPIRDAASASPAPLYSLGLDNANSLGDRRGLVDLEGIEAPYPQLHDLVDEAFVAVRLAVGNEIGWDLLISLENAFVPLTAPLAPGLSEDWLYTGRAFTFITSPIEAGWMTVVREDFGQETYWRVFALARYQDGSQGQPLHAKPWLFSAQNNSDISLYEAGGGPAGSIPPGYWIDITSIAAAFGWERLPALVNWRSFFPGTRLNEFVMRDGLDWRTAMLELYPPEILITPTVIIPPTRTPTPTIRWWRTPTPSSTPVPPPTLTPSPSP